MAMAIGGLWNSPIANTAGTRSPTTVPAGIGALICVTQPFPELDQ